MIDESFHPTREAFEAWLTSVMRTGGAWDAARARALAGMAFNAGWRRGWCASRGVSYPPDDGAVIE